MITAQMKAPEKITARTGGVLVERDPTVPAWAKRPKKPVYTAEEIGAQPKGDYVPAPVTAAPGQVLKISAVDENGKPVKWEAASLPTKEEIVDAVLAEIPVGDEVEY